MSGPLLCLRQASLRLATLTALALMLAGCAGSLGRLAVDLSALKECRKLTPQLNPPPIGEDSDYRDLAAQGLGQLSKANRGIVGRNRCDDRVIDDYARAQ